MFLWFSRSHLVHLFANKSQSILQNVGPWAESRTQAQGWNMLSIQRERHFALVVRRGREEQKFPHGNCGGGVLVQGNIIIQTGIWPGSWS